MELINTHPIKKSDLGFHGNLFGGKLMAWIDASAAAYAMEYCHNRRMVRFVLINVFSKNRQKKVPYLKFTELLRRLVIQVVIYTWKLEHSMFTHTKKK